MTIDKIREQLGIEITQSSEWINVLNDSNPGHYGVEEWDVYLHPNDIWVDIPNNTFRFKNAKYDFELLLGSSNYEDGQKMNFSKAASGKGVFEFAGNAAVKVQELEIEMDLDLFSE